MKSLVAVALVLALGCAAPAVADDSQMFNQPPMKLPTSPVPPEGLGSDTIIILVSDTTFGPDMEDANLAARFYCSTRGKLATFVGKDHPPELRTQVFQQWTPVTYHCITAVTAAPQAVPVPGPAPAQ
jgi:hypothetical protein